MPVLDTNILIYSAEAQYSASLLPLVTDSRNLVSSISLVETLGYHKITPAQILYFESLFKVLKVVPVDDLVVQTAIRIRQNTKLSLGDSLIAATSLVYGEDLISRNIADFSKITGLRIINPLP